jgi:hypothetical protein
MNDIKALSHEKQEQIQNFISKKIFRYSQKQILIVSQNEIMIKEKIQFSQQLISLGIKVTYDVEDLC